MITPFDQSLKFLGNIKCVSVEEQPDGTCLLVFDYDESFKNEYKNLFNLKRFSKKHFEKTLSEAMMKWAERVESERNNGVVKDGKDDQ